MRSQPFEVAVSNGLVGVLMLDVNGVIRNARHFCGIDRCLENLRGMPFHTFVLRPGVFDAPWVSRKDAKRQGYSQHRDFGANRFAQRYAVSECFSG